MKLVQAISMICLAAPAVAQYGPAIRFRGEEPLATPAQQVAFRPFIEVAGVYASGLDTWQMISKGDASTPSAEGLELTAGITGTHTWPHTSVGAAYSGSFFRYATAGKYSGSEQSLTLTAAHQFTRHTRLALREDAGMFSRVFDLQASPQTMNLSAYPFNAEFFDNRTIYLATQADFTVQKSARLSFNVGGGGNLIRRRETALYGTIEVDARSDVQYRLTHRSTIGAAYTYTRDGYHGVPGSANLHGVVGACDIQLTKSLELSAYGGPMISAIRLPRPAALDLSVAPVLGISGLPAAASRVDNFPNVGGRLEHVSRRGIAYVSGGRTVTPGNGLFLASSATFASTGYTYTERRRWTLDVRAAYNRAKSIGNAFGWYADAGGTVSLSRQIGRYMQSIATFGVRRYQSPDFSQYNRLIYQARLGIAFTPRDLSLGLR